MTGLSIARGEGSKNRNINAAGHTIGPHISLGDSIKENPADGHSMEVIAHEVSHALARGGSGKHLLDRPGDHGEHAADKAGQVFRHYVEGGARGPAPQLQPAHGGQATVHRFEAGEHDDVVDSAAAVLQASGQQTDEKVTSLMNGEKIRLRNGVEVSPGEITAMMGDFYGAFNKDGTLNPAKSFDALNNADPKEMKRILDAVQKEKADVDKAKTAGGGFKATDSGDFEAITRNRRPTTDADGVTTGLSMLELAQKNDSHFSKKDESGTNNNMGAYREFHQMALDAAQRGDRDTARALEASAMHYLSDRFASGHLVDKEKTMDASGHENGKLRNVVARIVHNDGNEHPASVQNENGQSWKAMGDEHWADSGNKENREHTSKAVYTSFSEIEQVLDGKKTAKQITKEGFRAHKEVPKFDDARQEGAESTARHLSLWDIAKTEAGEAPGAVKGMALRAWGQYVENPVSDAYHWGKEKLGNGWDWLKEKGGNLWNGAQEKGGQALDWAQEKGGQALDWGKEKGNELWQGAKNFGSSALNGTKSLGSQVLNGVRDLGNDIRHGASEAWDGTKHVVSNAWSGTKKVVSDGVSAAKDGTSLAWNGAKGGASSAYNWLKSKF